LNAFEARLENHWSGHATEQNIPDHKELDIKSDEPIDSKAPGNKWYRDHDHKGRDYALGRKHNLSTKLEPHYCDLFKAWHEGTGSNFDQLMEDYSGGGY